MSKKVQYFEYNPEGSSPLRIPMTEEKFLEVKGLPDRWFIRLGNCVLEVSKEEYDKYYKEYEHSKYCRRDAAGNYVRPVKLDKSNPDHVRAFSLCMSCTSVSIEDVAIDHMMSRQRVKRLHEALEALDESERTLMMQVFFENQKQSDLAVSMGVTQQCISKRIKAILKKLEIMLADLKD